MSSEFQVVTQSVVSLLIIRQGQELGVEKRFAKDLTVADLKSKLELVSGFAAADITLKLLDKNHRFLCTLDDNEKPLGFYPADNGCSLEVTGTQSVILPDDPDFKRFELTDEEYAKKSGTVKDFKMKMKLGQYSSVGKELKEQKEKMQAEKIETERSALEQMHVGARCQVRAPNAPTRLGTVMYLGQIDAKPGYFVGVKYDEPLGKNNGSIDGKQYFECAPNYGGFLKPDTVTIGDFPEESLDDEI